MNSRRLLEAVEAIVRAWAWLYTAGLRPELRWARRATIDSDLWEQRAETSSIAQPQLTTAASILSRCVSGMGADLLWRLSHLRDAAPTPIVFRAVERTPNMSPQLRFAVLSALAGLSWALVLVGLLAPTPHSLAYAGGALVLIALAGWVLEMRAVDASGLESPFSAWPPLLALGIASIAIGLLLPWQYGGLVLAAPMALLSSRAWLLEALEARAGLTLASVAIVPADALAARVAAGDVIAIERGPERAVSRRALLRTGLWLSLGATVAAAAGSVLDFLWERKPEAFGGIVVAGRADQFPPGTKTKIQAGRFWLVNLTEEQGGPGFLALWQKCPHLGCTVPWLAGFSHADPKTGETTKGWFRCPCHQSTYDHAGVRVFGPAPRSMDRMDLQVNPQTGSIEVNTGKVAKGTTDNATFAVRPPATAG